MYVAGVQTLAQQKKDIVVDRELSSPNYVVFEEQVSVCSDGISS